MKQIEKDINQAIALLEFYKQKEMFDDIYPFSNENINDMFSYFDFENKDCLTVLASSDQTFDMYLRGAKSVTAFDSNPLTKHYFYLKKAFIKSGLSYEQFIKFFCYEDFNKDGCNRNAFGSKIFEKIYDCIEDEDSKYFWGVLFSSFKGHFIRKPQGLFKADEEGISILKQSILYLHEENYYNLQSMIDDVKIDFLNHDIRALPVYLNNEYDIIYLSNIIKYVDIMYLDTDENEYKNQKNKLIKFRKLTDYLFEFLKDNGYLIVGYIYLPEADIDKCAIYNKRIKSEVFNYKKYNELYFKAQSAIVKKVKYNEHSIRQDSCLVRKKERPL